MNRHGLLMTCCRSKVVSAVSVISGVSGVVGCVLQIFFFRPTCLPSSRRTYFSTVHTCTNRTNRIWQSTPLSTIVNLIIETAFYLICTLLFFPHIEKEKLYKIVCKQVILFFIECLERKRK